MNLQSSYIIIPCCTNSFGGDLNKSLFITDRVPMIDKNNDYILIQLGEPIFLLGLLLEDARGVLCSNIGDHTPQKPQHK